MLFGLTLKSKIVFNLKVCLYRPFSVLRNLNICMCHSGRCGSTVIADLIQQDGRIDWAEEILEPYSKNLPQKNKKRGDKTKQIHRIIKKRQMIAGYRPFGFELKLWHYKRLNLEFEEVFEILQQLGFNKYIFLERKNYLRQNVSWLVAEERGQTHLSQEKERNLIKVKIDVSDETLLNGLRSWEHHHQEIKEKLPQSFLYLCYEDDIQSDPYKGYSKIMQYIGYSPKDVSPKLVRTNPYKLSNVIENYDEVSNYFENTPFNWMIRS